eukprot:358735-Chlamydomonas_euryale.AAC.3
MTPVAGDGPARGGGSMPGRSIPGGGSGPPMPGGGGIPGRGGNGIGIPAGTAAFEARPGGIGGEGWDVTTGSTQGSAE